MNYIIKLDLNPELVFLNSQSGNSIAGHKQKHVIGPTFSDTYATQRALLTHCLRMSTKVGPRLAKVGGFCAFPYFCYLLNTINCIFLGRKPMLDIYTCTEY